jgi:hypothetical protein
MGQHESEKNYIQDYAYEQDDARQALMPRQLSMGGPNPAVRLIRIRVSSRHGPTKMFVLMASNT